MPTHCIFGWLFPRAVALVYGIAFASWGVQAAGLVGEHGIVPVPQFLEAAQRAAEARGLTAWLQWPTVFWLGFSDAAVTWLCLGAGVAAVLVMAGVAQGPLLLALWAGYLSLVTTGNVFMSFQWDVLLLEAGLIAALVAPWRLWVNRLGGRVPGPSRWQMLLPQLLIVKLMFLSGWVKLSSGDETWWNLTALEVHYESQPLPTWIGWWAHQLPAWAHKASCAVMFVVELGLPVLFVLALCLDRRLPRTARWLKRLMAVGTVGLMLVIAVTGNYTFFNLLTALLALSALDDACWSRLVQGLRKHPEKDNPPAVLPRWKGVLVHAPLVVLLPLSSLVALMETTSLTYSSLPGAVQAVVEKTAPFHSVNSYGLFRQMTTDRHEIVVEVSDDGTFFQPIEFRWKPGRTDFAPRFVAPHQPRLDWQMWFAALHPGFLPQRDLNSPQMAWFGGFLSAILEQRQPVLDLLGPLPFPSENIRAVRAEFYRYRFTDRAKRRETGEWWTREYAGHYSPKFMRRS